MLIKSSVVTLLLLLSTISGQLHSRSADSAVAGASSGDLWSRVRSGFHLANTQHPEIDKAVAWVKDQPIFFANTQRRARPYLHFIVTEIERRGMPLELALVPAIESGFRAQATSEDGAAGLWQFIARTGDEHGLSEDDWYDKRRDVIDSTHAALDYLSFLSGRFKGDWEMALAAYNVGIGNIRKAISKNKKAGKPVDFWSLDLPQETRDYVPRLYALCRVIAHPALHGMAVQSIPDRPYFTRVPLKIQLDLARAAEMAGISEAELTTLNPGFKRWVAVFRDDQRLLIPLHAASRFRKQLALMNQSEFDPSASPEFENEGLLEMAQRLRHNEAPAPVKIETTSRVLVDSRYINRKLEFHSKLAEQRQIEREKHIHIVKKGDSLEKIAAGYNVQSVQLSKWNSLDPERVLIPGQELVIWVLRPV